MAVRLFGAHGLRAEGWKYKGG